MRSATTPAMGRKGFLYSVMALMLVLPSIILVTYYFSSTGHQASDFIAKIRAEELNDVLKSMPIDLERSLSVSTMHAILYATQTVATSGSGFSNSEVRIAEMVSNGTLDGVEVPVLQGDVGDPCDTVRCWRDAYLASATKSGYDYSIQVKTVDVRPYDSWSVNTTAFVSVSLNDSRAGMSVTRNITVSSIVSIAGFEDPLYVLKTQGKVPRLINKSTNPKITVATSGRGWWVGTVEKDTHGSTGSDQIIVANSLGHIDITRYGGGVFGSSTSVLAKPYLSGAASTSSIGQDRKIFIENITFGVWDLSAEIAGMGYHESYDGPSFLDRLEGATAQNPAYRAQARKPIGLVSFVNYNETGTTNQSRSCADYVYFSGGTSPQCT
jgi:hypothetical protein